MRMLYNKKGFSLIEIIISMGIFGIISIVFLTMFTSSFMWVINSGDKAEAYNKARQDVESRLASGEVEHNPDLSIYINGKDYVIRGGLIETEKTVGKSSSKIETFVPLVPTIVINPMVRYEGEESRHVNITGYETSFNGTTVVELYDGTGQNKIGMDIIPVVSDPVSAGFTLPPNLANNDYIIKVTTRITGQPDQTVRAKYLVEQPRYLAVGNTSVYISANGLYWEKRSDWADFPLFTDLNDVVSSGSMYAAVGNDGLVLTSADKQPWTASNICEENLLSIEWAYPFGKFYASGDEGGIYCSQDGSTWLSLESGTTNPINDICSITFFGGNSIITAVGNNGTILTSANGVNWSVKTVGTQNINAVSCCYNGYLDLIIAACDNGMIIMSLDGKNWSIPIKIANNDINDIKYNDSEGYFIAVGDNGLILTSQNGLYWEDRSSGTQNLNSVYTRGNISIAVGDNRTILYSEGGGSWAALPEVSGDHIMGLAGK